MKNIKDKLSLKNKSNRKEYSVPQLKRIGTINRSTLASPTGLNADSSLTGPPNLQS